MQAGCLSRLSQNTQLEASSAAAAIASQHGDPSGWPRLCVPAYCRKSTSCNYAVQNRTGDLDAHPCVERLSASQRRGMSELRVLRRRESDSPAYLCQGDPEGGRLSPPCNEAIWAFFGTSHVICVDLATLPVPYLLLLPGDKIPLALSPFPGRLDRELRRA